MPCSGPSSSRRAVCRTRQIVVDKTQALVHLRPAAPAGAVARAPKGHRLEFVMIFFGVAATQYQLSPSRSIRPAPWSRLSIQARSSVQPRPFMAFRSPSQPSRMPPQTRSSMHPVRDKIPPPGQASATSPGRFARSMDERERGCDTGMGTLLVLVDGGSLAWHHAASCGAERSHLPLLDAPSVTNHLPRNSRLSRNTNYAGRSPCSGLTDQNHPFHCS